MREDFHIPKQADGSEHIYFCGNSLGLQPKNAERYIREELTDWQNLGVEGHFHARRPWMPYHEQLTSSMAKVVGALPSEVVVMNSLTVNLHLLLASFYQPTKNRYKIIIEQDAFPSDRYVVQSQADFNSEKVGFNSSDAIITWTAREGENCPSLEDLETLLNEQGEQVALIMIGAVNYYTGQWFDLKKITELGHKYGCVVGFDCAHGAGNVPLELHDSGADFAAWCSYKYLNSGPGGISGIFIHERHAHWTGPRFTGWWGHNKETRFKMRDAFEAIPGAEGWQLSNPPIFQLASLRASLDHFDIAGIYSLRKQSLALVSRLESGVKELGEDRIEIITPSDPNQRGCQLSIRVIGADKSVFNTITEHGVIGDWREPDVIRVATVPLYNNEEDIDRFCEVLKEAL